MGEEYKDMQKELSVLFSLAFFPPVWPDFWRRLREMSSMWSRWTPIVTAIRGTADVR